MPAAICVACSEVWHWRNRRGTRLAEMRCKCGGALVAATYRDGAYIKREVSLKPRGKRLTCPLTGRTGFAGAGIKVADHALRLKPESFAARRYGERAAALWPDSIIPPGTPLAWYLASDLEVLLPRLAPDAEGRDDE